MESHATIKGPPSQRQAFRCGLFERTAAPPFFKNLIAMEYSLIFFTLPDYEPHRFRVESRVAAIRLMDVVSVDYDVTIWDYNLFPIM